MQAAARRSGFIHLYGYLQLTSSLSLVRETEHREIAIRGQEALARGFGRPSTTGSAAFLFACSGGA
jgi:hypothetical protein